MIEIENILDVMKHLDGLRAVVFDLDDTLYSEKQYVRSGFHSIANVIPQVENVEEKLWQAFKQGETPVDSVLMAEGIYSEKLKEECLQTYRSHKPDISLYLGVKEMLEEIRKKGLKIGIITDGRPEGQRNKIDALGLKHFIDIIVITDELGGLEFRKPSTCAFEQIHDLFGIEDYRTIGYVGDNIRKDFIAPKELDMKAIWFINPDGLYFSI